MEIPTDPMNSTPSTVRIKYRRRRRYVDAKLQKGLLAVLVMVETTLVALSLWLVYLHLNKLIEDALYRVHLAKTGPMLPVLLHDVFFIFSIFVVANAAILLAVIGLWCRHVNFITGEFGNLTRKTGKLDFSPDLGIRRKHELLTHTGNWRAKERVRFTRIREEAATLERELCNGADTRYLVSIVRGLKELLPDVHSD